VLNDLGNAHNIAINEDTGFAYVVGSQLYNGGPVFIEHQRSLKTLQLRVALKQLPIPTTHKS
jgi:hypothetical protein